jgi:hypothetical protein
MSPVVRGKSTNPRKKVLRAVATLATAGLAVASIVALATDDLKGNQNGGGLQVLSGATGSTGSTGGATTGSVAGSAPASSPASAGVSSSATSGASGSSSGALSQSSTGGATGSSSSGTGSVLPSPIPSPSPSPSPGSGPRAPSQNVAVVSNILQASAFGSHVVLPLLCGVAIGGFGPFLANPALAKLATTISSSCVVYGNDGAAAFTAMNKSLAALAAANPALDPLIAQLAKMFNTIGSTGGVPFASSLIQLAQFIAFFEGTPQA